MKLYLEFSDKCFNCPAWCRTNHVCNELHEAVSIKQALSDNRHPNCPARISPNDEIRAGEIAALKAEIQRLQAIIRGEV